MKLKRLNERVYYSECDPSADRPVIGYILGDDFSIMIDAGNSRDHVSKFYQLLKNHHLPYPRYCIITHWHWDHTFGLHAIPCDSIAHFNTSKELKKMMKWKWSDEEMKQRLSAKEEIEFADVHIRKEYSDLTEIKVCDATLLIDQSLMLNCGGISCHCLHVPSAHSDDSLIILAKEAKVVFLGDVYNDDFYHDHFRDIKKTKELCEILKKMDFELAVVGHSEPLLKEKIIAYLERF